MPSPPVIDLEPGQWHPQPIEQITTPLRIQVLWTDADPTGLICVRGWRHYPDAREWSVELVDADALEQARNLAKPTGVTTWPT